MNSPMLVDLRLPIDQGAFDEALAKAPFAVFDQANGEFRRIPAALDALSLDRQTWEVTRRDATLILDALVKLATHFLTCHSAPEKREILAELSPFEKEVLCQAP